jgi:hypothetical protein
MTITITPPPKPQNWNIEKIAKQSYFCICEDCCCLEWISKNGTKANGLLEDGSLVKPNQIMDLFEFIGDSTSVRGLPICQECEGRVAIFGFTNTKKAMRKKLFKMTKEEKKQFIENSEALYELEKGLK